ncbi:glucan 1,3-beta-glucosidase precursor [Pseudomassariella vexata]|uniref:glucan 1,3-beta-glucosidase n=1 Tax=Pseudomassariella vexata TaxID=1141098 RepID=A0A1Y2E0B2_9PEZI|nr:glucan 1,3-beta-glucosidase precursor [Pseudomassariella vexata]ORY64786.1 glucan 1,3-beta-glucosidase precursor [Pseudomassariella vexata]
MAAAVATLLTCIAKAAPAPIISLTKRDLKFAFGDEKIRGVNLGGWLVLEPWITPSIFEATPDKVVDEYTLGETLGQDAASTVLQKHWSTWITAEDFTDIASKGLNFVRIPIGYWAVTPLEGDTYVSGAYEYLGKALDWAQAAGIKVMIDLHGAPGSQNGLDNSGKRGTVGWTQGDTVAQTLTTLNKIRDDHAAHPAVAAIELLNEPMSPKLDMNIVRQFMSEGAANLENTNVAITFHDAFTGVTSWNSWGSGLDSLLLDTHHYEVFDSGSLAFSINEHVSSACGFGTQMASTSKWTIAGEFTGAVTDCAKWLNGRGVGARYDGTYSWEGATSSYIGSCEGKASGTVAGLSDSDKSNIKSFVNAQIVAYEKAAGWIFWTWKNEAAPEWNFKDLAEAGLIPQPLSSTSAGVCG